MTCPAFRALATITRQLADLASFLAHPVAGWTAAADELWARAVRPRDGAERLADKEVEVEVGEPTINSELKVGAAGPCPSLNNPGCDRSYEKCHGFCWTRERGPVEAMTEAFVKSFEGRQPPLLPSDRLDTVIALLEDVRNLLQLSGTFTSDDLMDAARAVDYFTRERFGDVERCGAWGRLATRLETAAETAPK